MKRVGLIIFIISLSIASLGGCSAAQQDPSSDAPSYQVNESGQTYGSYGDSLTSSTLQDEKELSGRLPDLISVVSSTGEDGYVLKEDFLSDETTIPVFEVDGETLIGTYEK